MRHKSLLLISGFLIVTLVSSCVGCIHTVRPDQGQEAVLVSKPLFFGNGGISPTPIPTGSGPWLAWTTSAVYVNMQPQRIDLDFDDLMTSSGVPIDFHAVLSYRITNSVVLVSRFGADYDGRGVPGFFTRNLDQPFRTAVRDEVKKHDMQAMAILATAAEEVDTAVTMHLENLIKSTGVPMLLIDLSLGRANPPDAIKNQRIATAAEEQRLITEQRRKLSEDQRKAAETSRAEADQAYNAKMGLSPAQYVTLETIRMQEKVCATGKCTFLIGGGVLPTLDVR